MDLKDPIGQPVSSWFGTKGTIIGVVKDYHISSLHSEIPPMVLLFSDRNTYLLIRMNPGNLQETIKLWQSVVMKD